MSTARRKPAFDPIDEAARQWGLRWQAVDQMHAVTSLMRVQQPVLSDPRHLLKPHGLTLPRYEALVLLTFSRAGSLPLGKMGERLQVHPTSVTPIVDRLEAAGHVYRLGDRTTVARSSRRSPTRGGPSSRRLPTTWSPPGSPSRTCRSTTCGSCPRCSGRSGRPPATSSG